jgi:hypothetical protein
LQSISNHPPGEPFPERWTKAFSRNSVKNMKILLTLLFIGVVVFCRADGQTNSVFSTGVPGPTVETLVCLRHGEKPPGGLGQLSCRGLNRALALPEVLLGKYGQPQFVFAPNPTQKAEIGGYDYIRPLMTIEPTAICCGLPVNTEFGFKELKGLAKELQKPEYQKAIIFIAWEHHTLDLFARDMLNQHGGELVKVPPWPENDYDTIFVIKISRSEGRETVAFTIDHEGLDGLSDAYPEPVKWKNHETPPPARLPPS